MNAPIIAEAFVARQTDKDAFWLTLPEEEKTPPPQTLTPAADPREQATGQVGLHLTPKPKPVPAEAPAPPALALEQPSLPFRPAGL